jgi:hypothetical protein
MTLTTSGTLGVAAAAISLTSIPGTYKALMLWVSLRTAAATAYDDLILRVNGNTTAGDYRGQRHIIQAASYILENVGTVATLSNAYIVGNGAVLTTCVIQLNLADGCGM